MMRTEAKMLIQIGTAPVRSAISAIWGAPICLKKRYKRVVASYLGSKRRSNGWLTVTISVSSSLLLSVFLRRDFVDDFVVDDDGDFV